MRFPWEGPFIHECVPPRRRWRRKPWRCPICERLWEPWGDSGWQIENEGGGVIESVTMRYSDGRTKTFPVNQSDEPGGAA